MKLLLTCFSLIFALFSNAQVGNEFLKFEFPDSLPIKYQIDVEESVNKYFNSHPNIPKTELSVHYMTELKSYYRKYFESELLAKHDLLEVYLNNILKSFIPDSIIEENNLKIYLSNEVGLNASAGEDGTIIFNIYNFIYLDNEAEIAFILGHEVAHVLDKNGVDLMLLYDKFTKSNPYALINFRRKKLEKASQNSELSADFMACEFMEASDYSTSSAVKVMELFKKVDDNYNLNKLRLEYSSYLKTHPTSLQRSDSVTEWVGQQEGLLFKVDEKLFKRIKSEAVTYYLDILLNYNMYYECVELSLEEYLINRNKNVLYYFLESIRRITYVNSKLNSSTLLSQRYSVSRLYNILHKYDKIFIRANQFNVDLIEDLKSKQLYSYNDYFKYFKKVAIQNELENTFLTIGLYDYVNTKDFEYLNKSNLIFDGKYKNYIEYILNPRKKISGTIQLVYNETHFTKYNIYGFPVKSKENNNDLAPFFEGYTKKKYDEILDGKGGLVYMGKLKDSSFSKYLKLKYFFYLYYYIEEEKVNTDKVNQFIISPDLWLYMDENNLKRLDYLDMFRCRNGQKVLQALASPNGLPTSPLWTYSLIYYSNSRSSQKFNFKSFDVGVGSVNKNNVLGVLKYDVLTSKNYKN